LGGCGKIPTKIVERSKFKCGYNFKKLQLTMDTWIEISASGLQLITRQTNLSWELSLTGVSITARHKQIRCTQIALTFKSITDLQTKKGDQFCRL
jgi:hypothetical protein